MPITPSQLESLNTQLIALNIQPKAEYAAALEGISPGAWIVVKKNSEDVDITAMKCEPGVVVPIYRSKQMKHQIQLAASLLIAIDIELRNIIKILLEGSLSQTH